MPRLVVFIPHPDDESYAFAGLVALAAKTGWNVEVVCVTSGERGKRHDGGPSTAPEIGTAREGELRASCEVLGVDAPEFWRLPDGEVRHMETALIERIDARLRAAGADFVATLGPDGAYGHPDHVALHRAVEAVFASAGENASLLFPVFPKGLFLPQYEKCLAMIGNPPDPPRSAIGGGRWDVELDISAVRETKLAAIGAHRTQLPGGDPHAIFPPGIVERLLDVERYAFARRPTDQQRKLLALTPRPPLPTGGRGGPGHPVEDALLGS